MNDVNEKQLSVMIFFIPLVFKMSMLPSYLYQTAGVDGYVIVGIFAVMEFLQLWAVLFVCKKGGMRGIRERYGEWTYRLIATPLLFVILIKCLLFLSEIANYLTTFLFYNVVDTPILLTLLLVCCYFGFKGARTVARTFELAVWLLPVVILSGLIFGETDLQGDCLLSVFPDGGMGIPIAIKRYLIYTFDFSPLLFCNVRTKRAKRVGVFAALSVCMLVGCYMLFYCRYGRASFLFDCAFARLASFDTVISEVGSLDWIGCILWVTTAILNVSLKLNAVAEIGSGWKMGRIATLLLFCGALAVLLLKVWVNMEETFALVTGGVQYAVFAVEIALPLVMLCLFARRGGVYATEE